MKLFNSTCRLPSSSSLALMLLVAPAAQAQVVASPPPQGAVTSQLPLSGESPQGGAVVVGQAPVPGTTTSVNTLNVTTQTLGPFSGSVNGSARGPLAGALGIADAIDRGLDFNLGTVGVAQATRQAQGQATIARSELLPHIVATASQTRLQINLAVFGLQANAFGGVPIPAVVGPYNYFDVRARVTQAILDLTASRNYQSAKEIVRADEHVMNDARDLVVLAVGASYLQVSAAKERVTAGQAQLDTATALFQQASQQHDVGVLAQTDVNRSRIQMLTARQRLETLRNDLAKQKISLARLIGLPADDHFDVSDVVGFSSASAIDVGAALKTALEQRQDLKANDAQLRAARLTRSAARAERLPTLSVNGDYGVNGTSTDEAHRTFSATALVSVPLWLGGRTGGSVQVADAALRQRAADRENAMGRVEAEVRGAVLDMQAAGSQVSVADDNLEVAKENLELFRQKLEAGVSDNVELVQAQEAVATAQLDVINSVLAHNVAKLAFARALGEAASNWRAYLKIP